MQAHSKQAHSRVAAAAPHLHVRVEHDIRDAPGPSPGGRRHAPLVDGLAVEAPHVVVPGAGEERRVVARGERVRAALPCALVPRLHS